MAKRISKNVLREAKLARHNKFKEEMAVLDEQLHRAYDSGEDAAEILNNIEQLEEEYFGAQKARRDSRSAAKAEMRELKKSMPNRNRRGRPQIQWASPEAKFEQRAATKKKTEVAQVEEVGLMKAHRDLNRWEMIDAQRGIRKGEIMMIISETYTGYNKKPVVDAMCGADVFKGVPATALRSFRED